MATCCFSEPHCVQGSEAMDIAIRETKGFLKNQVGLFTNDNDNVFKIQYLPNL